MGKMYGYIRVSSREQNEDRQRIAMQNVAVPEEQIYLDKMSGKDFERLQYRRLIRRLHRGDVLYIKSIDRLGRNYKEIQEQWRIITKEKEADICVLDLELLDTRRGRDLLGTFLADNVLQVLSFVAENERDNIRQRQAEGIAAARARGVQFGRPRKQKPEGYAQARALWEAGIINKTEAARRCGMAASSFRDSLKQGIVPECREQAMKEYGD